MTTTVPDIVRQLEDLGMKFTVVKSIAEKVSKIQATLPKNEKGLPLSYVDPQLVVELSLLRDIDEDTLSQDTTTTTPGTGEAESVVVPLNYSEGFPTVNGLPFWERLDGELLPLYEMFKKYRDMKEVLGTRNLIAIAEEYKVPLPYIYNVSRMYHWTARAKAYDLYKAMEREAVREIKVRELESKHSKAASELFNLCTDYLKKNAAMLDPKTALQMLQLAVRLERLSLGLDPDKPYDKNTKQAPSTVIQNYQIGNGNVTSLGSAGSDESGNANINELQEIVKILKQAGVFNNTTEIIDVDLADVTEMDENCNDTKEDEKEENWGGETSENSNIIKLSRFGRFNALQEISEEKGGGDE